MTREDVREQLAKNPLEWDCTDPMEEKGIKVVRHYAEFVEISCEADIYFTVKEVRGEGGAVVDVLLYLSAIDVVQHAYSPYDILLIYVPGKSVHDLKELAEAHRLDLACRMMGVTE